jgi:hypothetical protein
MAIIRSMVIGVWSFRLATAVAVRNQLIAITAQKAHKPPIPLISLDRSLMIPCRELRPYFATV